MTESRRCWGWIYDAGAEILPALSQWSAGHCAEIPVGRAWDVVRLAPAEGAAALTQMLRDGVPLGPVLHAPHGIEVLLPVEALATDDLPGASLITTGEILRAPHPEVTTQEQGAATEGRWWQVPPGGMPPHTDAVALRTAYAAARVSSRTEES